MENMVLCGLFFLVTVHGVWSQIKLDQSPSEVKRPGETVKVSCVTSGYTMTSYGISWIRQKPGKALEWMGFINTATTATGYASSFQSRFSFTQDVSSSTQYLDIKSLTVEDSAVYFCAREGGWDAFDYWGKGTTVTVPSDTVSPPTVFPLGQCGSVAGDQITLGCLAYDFNPGSHTFTWTNAGGTSLDSQQYISPKNNTDKYTGVSVIKVSKADWDSTTFKCSVTYPGGNVQFNILPPKVTLLSVPSGDKQTLVCTAEDLHDDKLQFSWKKNGNSTTGFISWSPQKVQNGYLSVSVLKITNSDWDSKAVYTCEVTHKGQKYTKEISKAPITVTLYQPTPKKIFSNNQVELECNVTGEDRTIVSETNITWHINDQTVTNNITTQDSGQIKTSKLTQSLTEWKTVNTVRCSASRGDMTPVIQELTVNRGDGTKPKVTVHILPDEDIGKDKSAEVTLVCLVSSPVLQDYYITWSEEGGVFTDGVNFPPQKTTNGYSVTSLYITTKEKWNQDKKVFYCNVWPAGSDQPMERQGVSKVTGDSCECEVC